MARPPGRPDNHTYPNYAQLREEHASATAGPEQQAESAQQPTRPDALPSQSANFSRPPGLGDRPFASSYDNRLNDGFAQRAESLDALKEARLIAKEAKIHEAAERANEIDKDGPER